ncbi:hypothetical protein GQX74_008337 [Glossina fuscipes]|nr:hypothetical protein GQX74_008337 [Glossina fuscipes]
MAAVAGLYGLGEDRQHRKKQQQQQQHQLEQREQKEEQKKIAERKYQREQQLQLQRASFEGNRISDFNISRRCLRSKSVCLKNYFPHLKAAKWEPLNEYTDAGISHEEENKILMVWSKQIVKAIVDSLAVENLITN